MTGYILALDEGTTSARSCIVRDDGTIVAIAQREFKQHFPKPGWVEHDATEIWEAQRETITAALSDAKLSGSAIKAVGITNQRETTIIWDRQTGVPIAPAIVWQDRRTAEACERLRSEGAARLIFDRTGLVLDAYFSATKIAWILDHTPGARARAEAGELCFGTIDSWLIWKLSGGRTHATDVSNASRTMLFNIHTLDWDAELLQILQIPAALLPQVVDSSGTCAEASDPAALKGIPISGIAGDQQAALFGQLCIRPGLAKNTYGTGCFLLQNIGTNPRASTNNLLTTVAWRFNGRTEYALEGSVFVGGAVVQWLRDGLGIIKSSSEIEALAASVPDTGDVYLVPAFAGLGAPYWDQFARGTIVGITRGTTKAHIARAALEAITLQVAELVEAINADAGTALGELRVDGGAARNDLLLQMQADLLQVPVIRPVATETTVLGAAYLAGLAVGIWKKPEEIEASLTVDKRFDPKLSPTAAQEKIARWQEAVARSRGWAKN